MSIKSNGVVLLALAACSTACVTLPQPAAEIVLTADVEQVTGWFFARGEWTLFPSRHSSTYNPYVTDENSKCVSVVNDTGRSRLEFKALEGKRVIVSGYVVDYDSLSDGENETDKLMAKKYFKNKPVENYRLRQYVLVAKEVTDF